MRRIITARIDQMPHRKSYGRNDLIEWRIHDRATGRWHTSHTWGHALNAGFFKCQYADSENTSCTNSKTKSECICATITVKFSSRFALSRNWFLFIFCEKMKSTHKFPCAFIRHAILDCRVNFQTIAKRWTPARSCCFALIERHTVHR